MNIYLSLWILVAIFSIQPVASQSSEVVEASSFNLSVGARNLINLVNTHKILNRLVLDIKISAPSVKSGEGSLDSWKDIDKSLDSLMLRLEDDSHILYDNLLKLRQIFSNFLYFDNHLKNSGLTVGSVIFLLNTNFNSINKLLDEIQSSIKTIKVTHANISIWTEFRELGPTLQAGESQFLMEKIKEIDSEIENIGNEIVHLYHKKSEDQKVYQANISYLTQNITYYESLKNSLAIRLESNKNELDQVNQEINNLRESIQKKFEVSSKQIDEEIAKLFSNYQEAIKELQFQKSDGKSKEQINFIYKENEFLEKRKELLKLLSELNEKYQSQDIFGKILSTLESYVWADKINLVENDLKNCETSLKILREAHHRFLSEIEDQYSRKESILKKRLEEDKELIRTSAITVRDLQIQKLDEKRNELEKNQQEIHTLIAKYSANLRLFEKQLEGVNNALTEINSRNDRNIKELENKRDLLMKKKEQKEGELRNRLDKIGIEDYNHLKQLTEKMRDLIEHTTEYNSNFNLIGSFIDQIVEEIRLKIQYIIGLPNQIRNITVDENILSKEKIREWIKHEWGEGPELEKFKKEPITGAHCNEKTLELLGIDSYFKKESWKEYCNSQNKEYREKYIERLVNFAVDSILIIFDTNRLPNNEKAYKLPNSQKLNKTCGEQSRNACNLEYKL